MEGGAETPDLAPPDHREPLLLPTALGWSVFHQTLSAARVPKVRVGGRCLMDNGNYD